MSHLSRPGGKSPAVMFHDEPVRLFRQLSQDLGLWEEAEVQRAAGMLAARQYLSFLQLSGPWSSQLYTTARDHSRWNQLACLLKKYPFKDELITPRDTALKKFWAAEHKCMRVNQRFKVRAQRTKGPLPYEQQLQHARRWIQRVIGETPDYAKIWSGCGFGPGSSVGVTGTLTHSAAKLSSDKWSCTPTCIPFAKAALSTDPLVWEVLLGTPFCYDYDAFAGAVDSRLELTRANKITMVPKTALTERSIAIEPLLNGYVQKGIDSFLRRRLANVGIDLRSQRFNQILAYAGSRSECVNPFCTIDLSSASDSMATEVVRLLLPPAWFDFLKAVRCPSFILDGDQHEFHKFTSMGNGFCFPLETLIFASIVHSVYAETGDQVFSVYGDDIIVRQSSALYVLELLKYIGFTPNLDKTFVHGLFRESCGADYYSGENVRPYYMDKPLETWGDVYGVLNALRRHGLSQSASWWGLYESIPPRHRLVRPFDGADNAISAEHDVFMSCGNSRWCRQQQRWQWRELRHSPVADNRGYSPAVELYGALRGTPSHEGRVRFSHRRKTETKVRWC